MIVLAVTLLAGAVMAYVAHQCLRNPPLDSESGRLQGIRRPEHGPMGVAILALFAAAGAGPFIAMVAGGMSAGELARSAGLALTCWATALWFGIQFYRFACWTWFFVAGWLTLGFLPLLALTDASHIEAAERQIILVSAGLCAVPLRYLWKRRYDFWFESEAVERAIRFEQHGAARPRLSWRDDADQLKRQRAKIAAGTAGVPAGHREPLRGAGRAG